jgi:hypothetical protein
MVKSHPEADVTNAEESLFTFQGASIASRAAIPGVMDDVREDVLQSREQSQKH